jgi:general secretion pathway protein C
MTGVLTVIACAAFAAQAAGHVTEAILLGDAAKSPPVSSAMHAPPPLGHGPDKDPAAFVARNMFCSTCAKDVATTGVDASTTALPLRLLATDIGTRTSYATIVNTETQAQGAYAIDDVLPGAGKVTAIGYQFVDFENAGRTERLVLLERAPQQPVPKETPAAGLDEAGAAVAAGIKKIDDTTFEIDRNLIDQVAANPMAFAKGGRAMPTDKGLKLSAIRPGSAFATLGLANGDLLAAVNNVELTSADRSLAAFTTLREATSLELAVVRHGKPITLKYRVR